MRFERAAKHQAIMAPASRSISAAGTWPGAIGNPNQTAQRPPDNCLLVLPPHLRPRKADQSQQDAVMGIGQQKGTAASPVCLLLQSSGERYDGSN
jgi:hypothetical protein